MASYQSITVVQGVGPMAKAMSIAGLVVGGLIALTFTLDLALKIPFGGQMITMDVGFILCGGVLAYLSWNAMVDA